MSNQVADTILQQLGGNKFIAMTGAKSFIGSDDSLKFKIPGGQIIEVSLNGDDTYTLTVGRFNKKALEVKYSQVLNRVYADQLTEIFTHVTGLEVSL